eukprot:4025341-Pyramimonas_sp.AAC.1
MDSGSGGWPSRVVDSGRTMERVVPRDLFPLPEVTYSSPEQRRGPRRAAQRLGRKAAIGRRSNNCIAALNNLYGDGSFLPGGRPSQAQSSALDGILRA